MFKHSRDHASDCPRAFPFSAWSGRRDSNPRLPAWKAGALPAELHPPRPQPRLALRFEGEAVVGREGFEPSKAEGRQIYSLLRLTASLPRRCVFPASVAEKRASFGEARCEQPPSRAARPTKLFGFSPFTTSPAELPEIPYRARSYPPSRFRATADRWSWRRDSNPRPADYKSAALPD